jgi:flagellar basal-body rod protein FlgB
LEPVSAALILKALDGLSLRSIATAQNIANANTPDYRPSKVTFEDALTRAAPNGINGIKAVTPEILSAVDEYGGVGMRLDLELATASSTAGRYGALVEVLNRQLQIHAIALSGTR